MDDIEQQTQLDNNLKKGRDDATDKRWCITFKRFGVVCAITPIILFFLWIAFVNIVLAFVYAFELRTGDYVLLGLASVFILFEGFLIKRYPSETKENKQLI